MMDARLVFLLMVVVLFGAGPAWLALLHHVRLRGQAAESVTPPVAEACPVRSADGMQPAGDAARTWEAVVESGPDAQDYSWDPDDIRDAHLRRAHFRCARGDFAGALADYEEAEGNSGDAPDVFALGLSDGINGPALRAGLDAFMAAHPDCWPALRERAYQRLCAGDAEGAIRDCDAILAGAHEEGFALALRGIARRRTGDVAGAERDLDAAVAAASPRNLWPIFARAGVALLDGAPGAALADLRGVEQHYTLWPYGHCLAIRARRCRNGVALADPVRQDELEMLLPLFGPDIAAT